MTKLINVILYLAFTVMCTYGTALYASLFDDDAKAIVMGSIKFAHVLFDRWFWMFT